MLSTAAIVPTIPYRPHFVAYTCVAPVDGAAYTNGVSWPHHLPTCLHAPDWTLFFAGLPARSLASAAWPWHLWQIARLTGALCLIHWLFPGHPGSAGPSSCKHEATGMLSTLLSGDDAG